VKLDPRAIDVVVLCAGRGERLRPLTDSIPKSLVVVAGQPILGWCLKGLAEEGFVRVICVTGYLSNLISDYAGDGGRFGLELVYCKQDQARGTGDALFCARSAIRSDPFVVIYGDTVFPHLRAVLRDLLTSPTPKIVGARVEDASRYGLLQVGDQPGATTLRSVREKIKGAGPGLVNAGLYLLPGDIMEVLAGQPVSSRGELELPSAVEVLARSEVGVVIVTTDEWLDVGTPDSVAAANWLMGRPR
jgi:UDP-N-acetylglucosamine diphosphorylase / glucose-1-phosphate thymidylyltransferase / UDP-N-acetylgalactosamine diphosphorylase / glucosamine-1-phosphate N-acetyltransferase / galactosamine-1-phosphate N-acetyltransferase